MTFLEQILVGDGGDVPGQLRVAGELGDMLDHPLDNLAVAFPEGGHQAGDFSVVLGVNVGSGWVEQLDNVQVTSIGGQPKTWVSLFVTYVDLSSPENKDKVDPWLEFWISILKLNSKQSFVYIRQQNWEFGFGGVFYA